MALESITIIFLYFSLQYQQQPQQQQQPCVADLQQQQQHQQWNKNPIKTEIVDTPTADDSLNAVVAPPSSYNAKTSERMRQDEGQYYKTSDRTADTTTKLTHKTIYHFRIICFEFSISQNFFCLCFFFLYFTRFHFDEEGKKMVFSLIL